MSSLFFPYRKFRRFYGLAVAHRAPARLPQALFFLRRTRISCIQRARLEGWTAPEIGGTLSAALLVGALLTLIVGPLSDRRGRRRFLLVYEVLQAGEALLAMVTAWPPALVAAAVVGGFSRGGNGSAGPFAPLEQAWLAQELPAGRRGAVFSANAAIGFLGMALGALLAGGVHLLSGPLGMMLAYKSLFLLSMAGSVLAFIFISGLHEPKNKKSPPGPARRQAEISVDRDRVAGGKNRAENRMLGRLVVANTLNGLGIGMIAPLIAYWFALRFSHGPGSIGPALAGSFLLGALGSTVVARAARRYGLIRPVVVMRGIGLLLLTAVPLMPVFGAAAALFALRSGFNQGTRSAPGTCYGPDARPAQSCGQPAKCLDPGPPCPGAGDSCLHAPRRDVESAFLCCGPPAGGLPGQVLQGLCGRRAGVIRPIFRLVWNMQCFSRE